MAEFFRNGPVVIPRTDEQREKGIYGCREYLRTIKQVADVALANLGNMRAGNYDMFKEEADLVGGNRGVHEPRLFLAGLRTPDIFRGEHSWLHSFLDRETGLSAGEDGLTEFVRSVVPEEWGAVLGELGRVPDPSIYVVDGELYRPWLRPYLAQNEA